MFTISEIIGKDKFEKLKEEHDKHTRIAGDLETTIINSVFKEYINKEERDNLIKQAKTYSFSEQKLKNIEDAFNNFNEDTINYNIASDIIDARKHIKEHSKESFFSTISNIVIKWRRFKSAFN